MKEYKVKAPDGSIIRIKGPENATDEQLIQAAQAAYAQKPKAPEVYDPTEGMTTAQKFLAGTGKAFVDVGRGVGQLMGLVSKEDVDAARQRDQALMQTGAGVAGNVAGNVAATLPTAFIPGVNTVTGGAAVGAALGGLQPVGTDESRLSNMAMGGAAGGAARSGRNRVGERILIQNADSCTQRHVAGRIRSDQIGQGGQQSFRRDQHPIRSRPGDHCPVGAARVGDDVVARQRDRHGGPLRSHAQRKGTVAHGRGFHDVD